MADATEKDESAFCPMIIQSSLSQRPSIPVSQNGMRSVRPIAYMQTGGSPVRVRNTEPDSG